MQANLESRSAQCISLLALRHLARNFRIHPAATTTPRTGAGPGTGRVVPPFDLRLPDVQTFDQFSRVHDPHDHVRPPLLEKDELELLEETETLERVDELEIQEASAGPGNMTTAAAARPRAAAVRDKLDMADGLKQHQYTDCALRLVRSVGEYP